MVIDDYIFGVLDTYAFTGWLLSECKKSDDELVRIINENGEEYKELLQQFARVVTTEAACKRREAEAKKRGST